MNKYRKSRSVTVAKKLDNNEANQTAMWILGSFPLLALAAISYLMLYNI